MSFLLQENGDFILQENGFKILLESVVQVILGKSSILSPVKNKMITGVSKVVYSIQKIIMGVSRITPIVLYPNSKKKVDTIEILRPEIKSVIS